jgi:hypothetical protein
MGKNRIFIMLILAVIAIGTVLILWATVKSSLNYANGFSRKFVPGFSVTALDTLDLKFDSYYIAGNTSHHLYLANITAPQHLLPVNVHSLDTQNIKLQLDNADGFVFRSLTVQVDSPLFFMTDGTVPAIFKGGLENRKADPAGEPGVYFIDLEPLSQSSFAIRMVDDKKQARLGKLNLKNYSLDFPDGLLEKQVDGLFCTDGALLSDGKRERVVYVYLYRNEYLVMDTTLRMLNRGNTIDTNSIAKIEINAIASERSIKVSGLSREVNLISTISDGRLFINSGLKADNENHKISQGKSVIDAYDLDDQSYIHSFYVGYDGKKVRDFRVIGDEVIALYDRYIILFDLKSHEERMVKTHR